MSSRRSDIGLALAALLVAFEVGCVELPTGSGTTGRSVPGIDAGFLFGAAVAGYQVEGGDDAADWTIWENVTDAGVCLEVPSCSKSDNGPSFATNYAGDVARAASLGLNALRFSLEWERLEPVRFANDSGSYDPAALAYYHGLLNACADAGLTPMVTLTQGALPSWEQGVSAGSGASPSDWYGGWRGDPGAVPGPEAHLVQDFGQFAADMAKEFGAQVDLWLTEDLPMSNAMQANLTGGFPPGGVDRLTDLQAAVINLAYANAAAYDAIHMYDRQSRVPGDPPALVGSANLIDLYAVVTGTEPDAGALLVDQMDYVNGWLLPNAFINGNLDTRFNSTFGGSGPLAGGIGLVGLAGRADFFGLTYRGVAAVSATPITDAQFGDGGTLSLPGRVVAMQSPDASYPEAPGGETIDAAGLYDALVNAVNHYPILPIYVTEISLSENAQPDVLRPAYIVESVEAVQQAVAAGIEVKGIFYRSLVDGFEWQSGFGPRTGLYRVDFTNPARPRTQTQGATAYGQVAKALGVTPAIASQWVGDGG